MKRILFLAMTVCTLGGVFGLPANAEDFHTEHSATHVTALDLTVDPASKTPVERQGNAPPVADAPTSGDPFQEEGAFPFLNDPLMVPQSETQSCPNSSHLVPQGCMDPDGWCDCMAAPFSRPMCCNHEHCDPSCEPPPNVQC